MKLGCNDSPPLRHLLDRGSAEVDYFKVSSLTNLEPDITSALAYRPVLVHVGFGIGDSAASYADFDWAWFNAQLRRAGSPHTAMHVEVSTHNWPTTTDLRFQTRDEVRAMASHLSELCLVLRDRLEVPLLLENMDYMGRELKPGYGVFRTSVEPALLWGLVEGMGVDAQAFARALPLHAVRELHVSGPSFVEGVGLRDDHQELSEADYALLEWTLERTNAQVLTLEYPKARTRHGTFDEQTEALKRQLSRLRQLTT